MEIISGNQTRFWKDCWLGDCPLEISFHKLYLIASQPDIKVSKAFVDGQWCITFRRQLNENLQQDLNGLLALLTEVSLTEGVDRTHWALERSGKYSTKSLYRLMTSGGVTDTHMQMIWRCHIPLKVKIFVWMAAHDRI